MCESVMGNQKYWQTFLKQLRQDYRTPRFKTGGAIKGMPRKIL